MSKNKVHPGHAERQREPGQVPRDLRVPWVLSRIEQLRLPEVATACGLSLATVKRCIAEAERRIQRRRRLAP